MSKSSKPIFSAVKYLVLACILTTGFSFASAAWTGPTLPPPNGNVDVPLNVGTTSQSKIGSLLIKGLNSAGGALSTGFSVINGNVGVGTSTPRQKLSVDGVVGVRDVCITNANGTIIGPCLSGAMPAVPSITFTASPASIPGDGSSATLSWNVANANSVSIDQGVGVVPVSGSRVVTPTNSTNYTMTAVGDNGSATAQASVTVQSPTLTITANPTTIAPGQSTTLSWVAQGATSASINQGIGTVAASGSKAVTPAGTGYSVNSYVITATAGAVTRTAAATVVVYPDLAIPRTPVAGTGIFSESSYPDPLYFYGTKQVFSNGSRLFVLSSTDSYLRDGYDKISILNATDPNNISKIGSLNYSMAGQADSSFFATTNFLYTIENNSVDSSKQFRTYSISSPASPTLLGSWSSLTVLNSRFGTNVKFDPSGGSVVVDGSTAYVSGAVGGRAVVGVFDVSSNNPSLQGVVDLGQTAPAVNLVRGIAVSGNTVYVTTISDQLKIVDVSDKANPLLKSSLTNGTGGADLLEPRSVAVSVDGASVYVATKNGLEIVDVSDPVQPAHKAKLALGPVSEHRFVLSGTNIYMRREGGIDIVDVSNPASPIKLSSVVHAEGGATLAGLGPIAKLGQYLFTDTRFAPAVAGQFGDWLTVGRGIEIVNVANPNQPTHSKTVYGLPGYPLLLGTNYLTGSSGYLYGFRTIDAGDHRYAGAFSIFDISTPGLISYRGTHPRANAFTRSAYNGQYSMVVKYGINNTIFYGSYDSKIMDFSNPRSPVLASVDTLSLNSGGSITGYGGTPLFLDGTDLFMVEPQQGSFVIFDTQNKVIKSKIGSGFPSVATIPLGVYNGRFYMIGANNVLYVVNVVNKNAVFSESNTSLGTATLGGPIRGFVSGSKGYIVRTKGVEIFDLSGTGAPSKVGTFSAPNYNGSGSLGPRSYSDAVMLNNLIYIAGSYSSTLLGNSRILEVVDVSISASPAKRGSIFYNLGSGGLSSLYISGNYAYVNSGNYMIEVINISNPDNLNYSSKITSGDIALNSDQNKISNLASVGVLGNLRQLFSRILTRTAERISNVASVGAVQNTPSGLNLTCAPKEEGGGNTSDLPAGSKVEFVCTVR